MSASPKQKSSRNRKTIAVALAIIGIAGLSLASAAELKLNGSSVGAGESTVASCQPSDVAPIDLSFETAYANGEYVANQLTLSNINEKCSDHRYRVAVDGQDVAQGDLGTIAEGATGNVAVSLANVSAEDVTSVDVVIYK